MEGIQFSLSPPLVRACPPLPNKPCVFPRFRPIRASIGSCVCAALHSPVHAKTDTLLQEDAVACSRLPFVAWIAWIAFGACVVQRCNASVRRGLAPQPTLGMVRDQELARTLFIQLEIA